MTENQNAKTMYFLQLQQFGVYENKIQFETAIYLIKTT